MSENKSKSYKERINILVMSALTIAIVAVMGSIIKVPTPGGFVHLGDAFVLLAVVINGRKWGSVSAALGMFLVDALGGYMIWAPFTLIIKFFMAFIAGTLLKKLWQGTFKGQLAAFIAAALFMVIGYFLAGVAVIAITSNFENSLLLCVLSSLKDIPGNIAQGASAVIIALPLGTVVTKIKQKRRF